MISYLEGKIVLKKEKFIVLNVNGVGYKVFVSKKTLSKLPEIGKDLKVFCYLNVSENSLALYGFLDQKELEFFEILEDIRGVGPKSALEISSLGPLEKIRERIISQDEKLFDGVPGIGKKKAMTIILELTGKIGEVNKNIDEAQDALVNLGFNRQEAKIALEKIERNIPPEEKIKKALKILGNLKK